MVHDSCLTVIHYTTGNEQDGKDSLDGLLTAKAASTAASSGSVYALAAIREEMISFDLDEDHVELLEYSIGIALYTGKQAVKRARTRVGETAYNLFFNNCESFVNWAITGKGVSHQVQKAEAVTGTTTGVAMCMAIGYVLYTLFSGDKKKSEEDD